MDGKLVRDKLLSTLGYVLDCGPEVYFWLGKQTDDRRRQEVEKSAKKLFKEASRVPWAVLRKVHEGKEPILFIEKFAKWDKESSSPSLAAFTKAIKSSPKSTSGNESLSNLLYFVTHIASLMRPG